MESAFRTIRQVIRFLLVSGVSLCIDYAIYTLLTGFDISNSSWAKRVSFACIVLWGYFAHKHFTFRNRGFSANQPIRFAALYLTGWVLNSLVHDVTATDSGSSNPAFFAATFVWACWNFIGQKYFVFRSRSSRESQDSRFVD